MGIASKFSDRFNKNKKGTEDKDYENSDFNISKSDESTNSGINNAPEDSSSDLKIMTTQLDELKKNYAALELKYDAILRLSAERSNELKNVVERNKTDIQFAKDEYAKKFIMSIASEFELFFRVIDSVKSSLSDAHSESLVNLTKKLSAAFEKVEVSFEYPKIGEEANPDLHNIIAQTDSPDFKEGQIVNVASACWMVRGKVVKFADVVVAK